MCDFAYVFFFVFSFFNFYFFLQKKNRSDEIDHEKYHPSNNNIIIVTNPQIIETQNKHEAKIAMLENQIQSMKTQITHYKQLFEKFDFLDFKNVNENQLLLFCKYCCVNVNVQPPYNILNGFLFDINAKGKSLYATTDKLTKHQKNPTHMQNQQCHIQRTTNVNVAIIITQMRAVIRLVRMCKGDTNYPHMLCDYVKQGVNIGNRYHSHDFVPTYKKFFFDFYMNSLGNEIKQYNPAILGSTPFSTTKDKVAFFV